MKITKFSQFAGNQHTLQGVIAMLEQHRLPQTMVIEGPNGSGRKTLARLIAAGVLCGDSVPCGECATCHKVFFTGHGDLSLVLPEKEKATLSVDQIREIRSQAYVRPVEADAKVFIIGGNMNDAAQNAFLKVLEEPPAGVYFIIVCNHRNDLMETVLSRAAVFSLGGVSYEQALPLLQQEGVEISSLEFEQRGGLIGACLQGEARLQKAGEIGLALANALARGCRSEFLKTAALAAEDRLLHPLVLKTLYELLHNALMAKEGVEKGANSQKECVSLLGRRFTKARLLEMANIVTKKQKQLLYNVNGNLFFTALCSELLPRT